VGFVLGCFFNLGFAASAGCVLESTGKYWIVLEREKYGMFGKTLKG
jgi:hypothetical protein